MGAASAIAGDEGRLKCWLDERANEGTLGTPLLDGAVRILREWKVEILDHLVEMHRVFLTGMSRCARVVVEDPTRRDA